MDVYIYALCDPRDDVIRYVGRTVNLKDRYRSHLRAKWGTHRCCWIKGLKEIGLKPKMIVLEVVDESKCRSAEMWWIAHLKDVGYDLTNHSDGGDGILNPTPDTREKMSINAKKRGPIRPKGYKCSDAEKETNRNAQQKLSARQVLEIRKMLSENTEITYSDLADQYGVHWRTIVNIVSGRTYSHITGNDNLTSVIRGNHGMRRLVRRKNILPGETIRIIRKFHESGMSFREISDTTGIVYQIVWRIIRGMSYSWIR